MNQAASLHAGSACAGSRLSTSVQRWTGLVGGGALAVLGLTRRSKSGIAIAATGGLLAYIGAKAGARQRALVARSGVVLNCSPQEVYQFWRNFENLPLFMYHLESVTITGDRRSRWVAIGPLGKHIRWDAEIVSERENELIAWRSLPGSDVTVDGFVEFRPLPANRGTLVSATVLYETPAGQVGNTIAKMLGKDPDFMMRQDLRRLKALIETGEIPTTEGQTHGPRSATAAVARVLDVDRPIRGEATLAEVLEAKRRIA